MTIIEQERPIDPKYDVFKLKTIDVATESVFSYDCFPKEPYTDNDSNIRFTVPTQGEYWIKWQNIKLHTKARIVRQKKGTMAWTDIVDDDEVMFANNAIHACFRDVKLSLNLNTVDGGNSNYDLLAYVSNTLEFGTTAKSTHMQTQGYYIPHDNLQGSWDGAKYKETTAKWDDKTHAANVARLAETEKSKWITFESPLKIPIFQQEKLLPPGFTIDLEFTRNDPRTTLVVFKKDADTEKYRVEFTDMKLVVPYVKADPAVFTAMERNRQNGNEILYQYNSLAVKRHTIPGGVPSWRFPNPFQNKQPKLVMVGFMDNTQLMNEEKRSYVFSNKNLKSVELQAGGRKIGGHELKCDDINEAYTRFNEALNIYNTNEDCGIDRDQFKDYNFYAAFDCTNNDHPEALQSATLLQYDIEVKFLTEIAKPFDMYLFYTFDNKTVLKNDNMVLSGEQVQPLPSIAEPPIKRQRFQ